MLHDLNFYIKLKVGWPISRKWSCKTHFHFLKTLLLDQQNFGELTHDNIFYQNVTDRQKIGVIVFYFTQNEIK